MEKQPVQIIPYLAFHSNCEEALNTYLAAFGAEMLYLSRWSEKTYEISGQIGKVMHAECLLGTTAWQQAIPLKTEMHPGPSS